MGVLSVVGRRKIKPVSLACREALSKVSVETLPEGGPAPERLFQAGVSVAMSIAGRRVQVVGTGGPGWGGLGASGVIRLNQAPLDRLFVRGRLADDGETNKALMDAGEKLRTHHYLAGLSGFASNDPLSSTGGGHPANRLPITETMEANRRALRRAEAAMHPGDWRVVHEVVCLEHDLGQCGRALGCKEAHAANAVALDRLRRGLAQLAELWSYSPPPRPAPSAGTASNDAVASATAAA